MSTIINNPTPNERTTTVESDSSGWAVAVIVLLLVIAGIAYWYYNRQPAPEPGTIINVTVPADTKPSGAQIDL
jgi:hypothetical protein